MSGDTAWILASTALVLLMVPGLALFYGGMVRSKNVLNMLNMNFYCLGIIPLVWVVVGMSIANGNADNEWLGFLHFDDCLLYTSPSPRDRTRSRMPSSA